MKTIDQIAAELAAPFPVDQIEWRVGHTNADKSKAVALAYIDARMVMDRLDAVVGPFGWGVSHQTGEGGKVTAHISVKDPATGEWVSKSDGAGATDVEGDKGSYSDATKRAAVSWGIARYLYRVKTPWVALVAAGRSYRIADHEMERLYSYLPNNADTLKVSPTTGLAKTPGKFWTLGSLVVPLKKEYAAEAAKNGGTWSKDAWQWWITRFKEAVEKAPSRDLLVRFQLDNQHILDQLASDMTMELNDACSIRASQFE